MPTTNLLTDKIAANFLSKIKRQSMSSDCSSSPWTTVKEKLKNKYGDKTYNSWIKPIILLRLEVGHATLSVPTEFIKEWVDTYYLDSILEIWRKHDASLCTVEIHVNSKNKIKQTDTLIKKTNEHKDELSSPIDPLYTFDRFVVGKSNELAFAAAKKISETDTVLTESNPLFLYGGVGLGKTHLMHAIAWNARKQRERKVVYLSAEKFMYLYINALRNKSIMMFKEKFRSVDILMIDDVQFISGKDSTQEEFFHTFNSLMDQKKQLVISADRSPSDLNGVEERIKSRLGWGLVADIHEATFELRMGILESKVQNLSVKVPSNVIRLLAEKITSNIRELEGALNKVIAHSSLVNREITFESTKEILSDLIRSNLQTATIPDIQKAVANHFQIKTSEMLSNRRLKNIVLSRQVAMYICKELTNKSLPDIGKEFNGKGHATVIHSINKIRDNIKKDTDLEKQVKSLLKNIPKGGC